MSVTENLARARGMLQSLIELPDDSRVDGVREIAREVADLLPLERTDDTRQMGGAMVDAAGDPYARGGVALDTSNALLFDHLDVSVVHQSDGRGLAALLFEGRINRSQDRAKVMLVTNEDGLAAVATQVLGLVERAGKTGMEEFAANFLVAFEERQAKMPQRRGGPGE